jgi:hypothetical protein
MMFMRNFEPLLRNIPTECAEFLRKNFIIWTIGNGRGWPWRWYITFSGTLKTCFVDLKHSWSIDCLWWRRMNLGTVL